MNAGETNHVLPAGSFGAWLTATRRVQQSGGDAVVPCGECTACCTSWQFVLVEPHETDTLAHIPRELMFPAPGMPEGCVVLGYDRDGQCPMFADGRCSIYDHRPRTCREYDCRVFTAAGYLPDDPALARILERTERWRFEHPTPEDRRRHDAVQSAAAFLDRHRSELPPDAVPGRTTQRALVAIAIHELFLDTPPSVSDVAEAIRGFGGSEPSR